MPKKKYNDEVLKPKALELRKRGYSYREIAKELGCSVYKVHELLAPIESPKSRLKQIAELASKVDDLTKRLDQAYSRIKELFKKVEEVEAKLLKYGKLESVMNELSKLRRDGVSIKRALTNLRADLTTKYEELSRKLYALSENLIKYENELDKLKKEVASVRNDLNVKYDGLKKDLNLKFNEFRKDLTTVSMKYEELVKRVENTLQDITSLKNDMELIKASVTIRTVKAPCTYIDEEGYCTRYVWGAMVLTDMKPELHGNEVVYRLNVLKQPLICTACPGYKPKQS